METGAVYGRSGHRDTPLIQERQRLQCKCKTLEIKADAQGLVCTVKLQTKKNILERPIRFVSFMKLEPKGQTVSLAEKKLLLLKFT